MRRESRAEVESKKKEKSRARSREVQSIDITERELRRGETHIQRDKSEIRSRLSRIKHQNQ